MKSQLANMLHLCTSYHRDQFDKGGNPYALHPIAVMHMLDTKDEELQCIALGHDLIEDTEITAEYLREAGFSDRIVLGIMSLTKQKGQTYEEYKQSVFDNEDAMRVKLCDLRHNSDMTRLKGVSEKDVARMGRYMKFYSKIKEKLND